MSKPETANNTLKEVGIITQVEKDMVFVQTQRTTGCSGCSSESGCGTSALAKLFVREKTVPLKVKKTLHCEVGDEVELLLDESRLLKHSFMAYGLPLITMFVGAIAVEQMALVLGMTVVNQSELYAIIGAVLGLYSGWKITQKFYEPVLPEIGRVLKKQATKPINPK